MKGRVQKISKDNCLQGNRAEPEINAGGQTFMRITENNITNTDKPSYGILEQILSPSNMNRAYKRVRSNKGSGGVDKMGVESLRDYHVEHKDELMDSILDGTFRPNPVRQVEIPKEPGKIRKLGIPTVVDRVVQQAISQILSPIFEELFSEHSYGFRPKRSAHQALNTCKDHISDGYTYGVDMDLEKFFDTVKRSKLIEIVSRTIKDGRVISLIHKYLNAGVVVSNKFEVTELGVPQGGPLSPLLSNIMLNELDWELTKRGHRFVRYADDLLILCKSKRSAERTLEHIVPFIEDKLFLRVNREKTVTAYISRIKFLGYSFYKYNQKGGLRIHAKSIGKMKERIKSLTSRSNGWGDQRRKEELRQYITGWLNYFKLADMKSLLIRIDEWYRRRIRMVIWKRWKRIKTRLVNLVKLGVNKSKSWEYANTRKGYWHIANSPILKCSITVERLKLSGYFFFSDFYRKVHV
jgi:group II intron reverse transcriptase/maturase